MRERDNLEDTGIDGRTILRHVLEVEFEGIDWIDVAQYMDRW